MQWIGYEIDFSNHHIGISAERAAWLVRWMKGRLEEGKVDADDLRAVLGRLSFSMGVLEYAKPFLAPVFAWCSALPTGTKPTLPWSISFIFAYLCIELESGGRVAPVRPRALSLGTVFRADAKAEGMTIVLGGWECRDGCPPGRARWFRVELSRATAPWAYARGEPFRAIAALEMFASLLSVIAFVPALEEDAAGTVSITGMTDNAGNCATLTKLMTSKFPLLVILTELAAQLRERRIDLSLEWVPRSQNEEAYALTNNRLELFDVEREIKMDPGAVDWLILPVMMKVADDIYRDVKHRRTGAKEKERETKE